MICIGLDMSLSATVVAVCSISRRGATPPAGIVPGELRTRLLSTTEKGAARLLALREAIRAQLAMTIEDERLIVMEGYAYGSAAAREALAELGGVVKLMLHEKGITPVIVAPSRLKKFITGSGVAEKSRVMLEVYKRWGLDCADDNQADAVGLCYIGRALAGDWTPTTDAQREVIAALQAGPKPKRAKKARAA